MEALTQPLAAPELSSYDLEAKRLHEEKPELFEQVELVLHLNAELARNDLTEDRNCYLQDERLEIVKQLIGNPQESILAEVDLLTRMYKDRCLVDSDYLGNAATRFITRDPERMAADLDFRIVVFPSGKSRVQIEVPLRGEMFGTNSQPYFITVDSATGLSIQQSVYQRGALHRQAIEIDSDTGLDRLWRFFTHSIMATELMDNRSEDEKRVAHAHARQLAVRKLTQQ